MKETRDTRVDATVYRENIVYILLVIQGRAATLAPNNNVFKYCLKSMSIISLAESMNIIERFHEISEIMAFLNTCPQMPYFIKNMPSTDVDGL